MNNKIKFKTMIVSNYKFKIEIEIEKKDNHMIKKNQTQKVNQR